MRRSTAPIPPSGHEGPIPDELVDEEHTVHEQLVEGIVVGDDDLMERYLEGETLDYAELEKSLAGGVASASVFPVLCCSATSGVGVDRLARLIEELAPSPASRPPVQAAAGTETVEIPSDPAGRTVLTVTKTFNDSHTGKMSLCKVVSGTLQPDAVLVNSRTQVGGAPARAAEHRRPRHRAGHHRGRRRLRGRSPAQRDAHRRHPRPQGPTHRRARSRDALPLAPGGGEAGDPGRRRQADVGPAAPAAKRTRR